VSDAGAISTAGPSCVARGDDAVVVGAGVGDSDVAGGGGSLGAGDGCVLEGGGGAVCDGVDVSDTGGGACRMVGSTVDDDVGGAVVPVSVPVPVVGAGC